MQAKRRGWDYWLPRKRLRTICVGIVAAAVLMWVVLLATSTGARTLLGTELGGDFPNFYAAGTILRTQPSRLYDLPLQSRIYHRLLPDEPAASALPYGYAPALAVIFRGLAALPYPAAYAAWSAFNLGIYLAAIWLLALACPTVPEPDRWMGALLAISFEPFLIECVHGGQVSAIALLLVSAAIALDRKGWATAAGACVGLLAYKPTLLIFLLPVFVLSGRWRMALGAAFSVSTLALASLAAVGWKGCADFVRLMISYSRWTTHGGIIFRTWKYVDANSFLQMRGLAPSAGATILLGVLWLIALVVLAWLWRNRPGCAWPATLAATLVINVYVPVYDSILIVPAGFLVAEWLAKNRGAACVGYFRWVLAAVWALPWISQTLAQIAGLQVYTLALAGMGIYALALAILNDDARPALEQEHTSAAGS